MEKNKRCIFFCIKNEYDLYFPAGNYDVGTRNFPFRAELGANRLLDCRGISIFGEGKNTVFMTSSVYSADVLQLNMIENLTIRDISITAKQKGFELSGSNGISITYGWNNVILDNITCFDQLEVNKGIWIDGGKTLTIQFGNDQTLPKGKIIVTKIVSLNNAYGFRFDGSHVDEILRWESEISVNIYVKRAFQGVSISFGSASNYFNSNLI